MPALMRMRPLKVTSVAAVGLRRKPGAGMVAEVMNGPTLPVIAWPAGLPLGYHRLTLTDAKGVTEEVPMIVAPERAFDTLAADGALVTGQSLVQNAGDAFAFTAPGGARYSGTVVRGIPGRSWVGVHD